MRVPVPMREIAYFVCQNGESSSTKSELSHPPDSDVAKHTFSTASTDIVGAVIMDNAALRAVLGRLVAPLDTEEAEEQSPVVNTTLSPGAAP